MADTACRQTVDCQYKCYAATADVDAGQTCANACAGTGAAAFTAYNACNGTTCGTPCLCP
jgi:hypothetical protein